MPFDTFGINTDANELYLLCFSMPVCVDDTAEPSVAGEFG